MTRRYQYLVERLSRFETHASIERIERVGGKSGGGGWTFVTAYQLSTAPGVWELCGVFRRPMPTARERPRRRSFDEILNTPMDASRRNRR